ncbi:MAG TPA: DUF3102 domain-containing protein [Polyangiaceae bacterium]|nr:DUF3102 domain-containing protein [Polyangiaceae bacterium]
MARSRTRTKTKAPIPKATADVIVELRPELDADPFDDPEIEQLTGEIVQQHLDAARYSVQARAENGRRLLEVKQRLKHGQWHAYLAKKVPYDRKTADRAIALYHFRQSHPARFEKLAPLGLTKAYLLMDLAPKVIDTMVKGEHLVPLTGETKPVRLMSKNELMSVLFPPKAEEAEQVTALTRGYRSATKKLIAQLDLLIDHAPLLTAARDTLVDLYDDLLHTLSRFSLTFALDDS